ncbi:hypothetical protein BJX63DRAFT_415743 [Aspergillus granulosus]|uniref:Uncharacterized protein n=1 Tax=Aspergillus granulosus TaxID=176169 RepID=A0ABR4GSU9_9EURO
MAHPIFQKIPDLQIIVCCQCKHGVHSKKVETHLRKKYYLPTAEIQSIIQTVQQWDDIIWDPAIVQIPRTLDSPLPIVPVHINGMQCRRDPIHCQYISTHVKRMRKHWREAHSWTQQTGSGRVPVPQQNEDQAEFQQSFRTVAWQQVFPTRKNSHLVHIRSRDPAPDDPPAPRTQIEDIVARIKARAVEDEREAASQATEAEQLHDANSWLRMTCWAQFATMVANEDLVAVVATPNPELDDPVSRATRVVWETIKQLARRSQQTVKHCGNGIRMSAVSTMPNQTPYQPLRAYMDEKSIQDHVRPWQQILLFIIRTQTDWLWRQQKPEYVMTTRQRKIWRRLWQLAMAEPGIHHAANRAADQDADPAADPCDSPDPMDPEEEHADRIQAFIITPIKTACLEFCIELLNQKTKVHKYKSLLVCAMAVLGRGEKLWRDPENYPPIISRVLKVAWFMVVQKALWLDSEAMEIMCMWAAFREQGLWTGDAADDQLGMIMEDEGFAEGWEEIHPLSSLLPSMCSDDAMPISPIFQHGCMPFQAGVDWMVRKFMVRGQHGPVEVLLDWRTFGMKIHYNTTAPGHVTWMGQERLLYKEISFTMGKFRSFVHGLVGTAREAMGGLLCQPYRDQWPAIPWDALFDNPTKATPGWSFLQDQRTQWPVPGKEWMVNWMAQEPAVAQAFIIQGEISQTKVRKYFQQVARFKEKLAIAMHLTGGAPARAPELLSVQHVNTKTNTC